jgi:polyketide cyclase/dehydrase/lipid transport protein
LCLPSFSGKYGTGVGQDADRGDKSTVRRTSATLTDLSPKEKNMRVEEEIEVSRSPADVFLYLADIRNEPRWNPWGEKVEMLTPEPIQQGSRFRGRYKRFGTVEHKLAAYEPDRYLMYASNSVGSAAMKFEVTPTPSGTRIHLIGEAFPTGIMNLLEPVMTIMMRRHFRDLADGIRRELASSP